MRAFSATRNRNRLSVCEIGGCGPHFAELPARAAPTALRNLGNCLFQSGGICIALV
ncbi:MAG: hypothetical protein LUC88_00235 [Prevotella sp.]|nr:hypothetical protein [Prevotella sp.]